LLVRDAQGRLYRAGTSQDCQILANQVQVERTNRISANSRQVF
ncbi:MAG: metal-dependent hydrolase, partial [Acaryochloris sp. SU_5_25]|nr:metal-dependent hydrolase [Acaryochloris sp. SU_5_25]